MTDFLGRKHILDTAAAAVLSDRDKAYGNPEKNFKNIADIWNWWMAGKTQALGIPPIDCRCKFTPLDVAHMMILMKMARLKTNPTHADSVVDVAGYAACAGDFLPTAKATLTGAAAPIDDIGIVERLPSGVCLVKIANGKRYAYDPKYWYYDSSIQSLKSFTGSEQDAAANPPIPLP